VPPLWTMMFLFTVRGEEANAAMSVEPGSTVRLPLIVVGPATAPQTPETWTFPEYVPLRTPASAGKLSALPVQVALSFAAA